MDKGKDFRLNPLIQKLKEKYGTHRRVARELGITEDWYQQVRSGSGTPSATLVRLMEKLLV